MIGNMNTMETVQEVDEPKESPPLPVGGSPIPPLTSVSSSSASPSSVKLNQNYIEKLQLQKETTSTVPTSVAPSQIMTNVTTTSNGGIIETNNDTIDIKLEITNNKVNNSEDDNEIDVTTPLLDGKNSTNINANDYNASEKDALLRSNNINEN